MRGDHQRAARRHRRETAEHVTGGGAVEAFGRLVEQPERRVAQEEPGQRQPARLAAGKAEAAFAKPRIHALWHCPDIGKQACGCEHVMETGLACIQVGKGQVPPQAILKEFRPLCQQRRGRRGNASRPCRQLAGKQSKQARLAGAAAADDGQAFALPERKIDILERRRSGAFMEGAHIPQREGVSRHRRCHWFGRDDGGKPRRDAPCRKQRPAEVKGAATQRRKRFDGRKGDEQTQGRNGSGDQLGFGKSRNGKQRCRQQQHRDKAETEGQASLDAVQAVVGAGGVPIGSGDRLFLRRNPPGHQQVGLAGDEIDRPRPQRLDAMGAPAGMVSGCAAGQQRQTEAGAGEKQAKTQSEQGMYQPQCEARDQRCADGHRGRHENTEIKGVESIDIGRQPEQQPCGTIVQGARRTRFGKTAKQSLTQGGKHAERGVMGRKPFAVTGCRADDGQQANAGRGRENVESDGGRGRKTGKRGGGDEPAGQAEKGNARGHRRGRECRTEQQCSPALSKEQAQDRLEICSKSAHSAASRRKLSESMRTLRCMRAASSGSWVATTRVRPRASESRLSVTSAAVAASRCAVGSSARISRRCGLQAARAIASRSASPPESPMPPSPSGRSP
ncbi:hypothetical protein RHECNPAF_930046 [Rhizobium etli CNPAF512]|nr:hypothetical protein RHECNPAF_930046 [Rhizobium etli CNPAF512]